MLDVLEIIGALAILVAFGASQRDLISLHQWSYLWLNLTGSLLLAVLAWHDRSWGFLLLEGVWALVTAWSMIGKARGEDGNEAAAH
jgi:hypothetical protein